MKRLLLTFLIIFPVIAFSEVYDKSVECFDTENLLDTLKNKHQEEIVFYLGNAITKNKSTIVMFKNETIGTWTIIEVFGKWSCVLAVGKETAI